MSMSTLVVVLVVGAGAGWVADRFATGKGFGPSGDAVIGVIGAFAGLLAARQFGVEMMPGLAGSVIHAAAGAVVLLALARVSQGGLGRAPASAKPASAKPALVRTPATKAAAGGEPELRPVRPEPRGGRAGR